MGPAASVCQGVRLLSAYDLTLTLFKVIAICIILILLSPIPIAAAEDGHIMPLASYYLDAYAMLLVPLSYTLSTFTALRYRLCPLC